MLASVLFLWAGIIGLAALVAAVLFLDHRETRLAENGSRTLYIAEAGLHHLWATLVPAPDFSEAATWTDGIPPFGAVVPFPAMPDAYRVRVDVVGSDRLVAVSTAEGAGGTRRAVEGIFVRSSAFRPPATLVVGPLAASPVLAGTMDVGAPDAYCEPCPALAAVDPGTAVSLASAVGESVPVIGDVGLAGASTRLRDAPDVTLTGPAGDATFGAPDDPILVLTTGGALFTGSVVVHGILLAEAPLDVGGSLEIDGLLLATAGADVDGTLRIRGAAWIDEALRIGPTGLLEAATGTEALDRADRTRPGTLPREVFLGAWREVW